MKRHKLSKGHSRKLFSKTAARVHGKNALGGSSGGAYAMRGGLRF